MVAWDNSSGRYSTWDQASAAWHEGLIAAGMSGEFQVSAIGGMFNVPPNLNDMQDINSFNLYVIPETPLIPEPATFALAGLGMGALLVLRRREGSG